MEQRNRLKSARTKTIDSHNSIVSIGSTDCIDFVDSIECEDSTLYAFYRVYRFYSFYTRATQKTANIHTTHKGKNNNTDGGSAEGAAPIGTVVCASAASAPLCVV